MKTLHLTVNRFWFDKIATGVKTTDYRDMSVFWYRRLWNNIDDPIHYDRVQIRNGYSLHVPELTCVYKGVRLVHAQTKVTYPDGTVLIPGASYGIDLGEIIEIKNWDGALDHKIPKRPIFLKDVTDKSWKRKLIKHF